MLRKQEDLQVVALLSFIRLSLTASAYQCFPSIRHGIHTRKEGSIPKPPPGPFGARIMKLPSANMPSGGVAAAGSWLRSCCLLPRSLGCSSAFGSCSLHATVMTAIKLAHGRERTRRTTSPSQETSMLHLSMSAAPGSPCASQVTQKPLSRSGACWAADCQTQHVLSQGPGRPSKTSMYIDMDVQGTASGHCPQSA